MVTIQCQNAIITHGTHSEIGIKDLELQDLELQHKVGPILIYAKTQG